MNKIILFFKLIFSAHLQATTNSHNAVAILQTTQKVGNLSTVTTIIIKDNRILVNGEALSPTESLLKMQLIKNILQIKPNLSKNICPMGTFKHLVKKDKNKELVESGCLGSSRHLFLKDNFIKLKKDLIIN